MFEVVKVEMILSLSQKVKGIYTHGGREEKREKRGWGGREGGGALGSKLIDSSLLQKVKHLLRNIQNPVF